MRLTVAAAGTATPATVWDRYTHPDRWPDWSPQIRSVDCADDVIRAGTTGVVHGPCGAAVNFEVLDVDHETRCWSWRVKAVGIELILGHRVDARGRPADSGTRTTLTITGPAPIVVGYLPLARVAMGRLVRLPACP